MEVAAGKGPSIGDGESGVRRERGGERQNKTDCLQ